jgi:hypothetical protein
MQKNVIFILIILTSCLSFSQNIKSITELKKQGDSLVKNRLTEFDKDGNKTKEVKFRKRSNRIVTIEINNGIKVSQMNCDYFAKQDTCVTRSFSKFEFDNKSGIEKQTLYESDSLIRFIRENKNDKRIKISKVYSWEHSPVEEPNYEKALVIIDTIFFDNKDRKTKRVSYNLSRKNPVIELYKYSDKNYTYQTIGTYRDTILKFSFIKNPLQKLADKKSLNYVFQNSQDYEYEIEYY